MNERLTFAVKTAPPNTQTKGGKVKQPTRVTIKFYLQPILGNSGEMADGCLKVEPGDVVLQRGHDGDEGHKDDADVHAGSQSSCVVPGWEKLARY